MKTSGLKTTPTHYPRGAPLNRFIWGWLVVVFLLAAWALAQLTQHSGTGLLLVLVVGAASIMTWLQLGTRPAPNDLTMGPKK